MENCFLPATTVSDSLRLSKINKVNLRFRFLKNGKCSFRTVEIMVEIHWALFRQECTL